MCLTTIGTVVSIEAGFALVEMDGVRRRASIALEPDVTVGDVVLMGLGAVLGRVAPDDRAALDALRQRYRSEGDVQ